MFVLAGNEHNYGYHKLFHNYLAFLLIFIQISSIFTFFYKYTSMKRGYFNKKPILTQALQESKNVYDRGF